MPSVSVVLVAATSLHAGFQLTVTLLVYPALAAVARPDFAQAHARHSRTIVPLVGVVYGAGIVAAVGALLVTPSSALVWSSAAATAVALATTAFRAAPLHARLGRLGPGPALLAALLRADRMRTAAALVAAAAAIAAALLG